MFSETIKKSAANARAKSELLNKSFGRYLTLSVLAGFYIGIAVFMVNALAAPLDAAGFPAVRLIIGLTFPVGLTLVVFAGAELFTGNVLFVTIGLFRREITPKNAFLTLCVCYIGNLMGALLLSFMLYAAGLISGPVADYIIATANTKADLGFIEITVRGVLCNMMVTLALWSGMRAKEEVMKFVIITLCLLAFIGSGYIHSIADMTHLALALLAPVSDGFGISDYIYVLSSATFGNIIGGVLIGSVYAYTGNEA